MKRVRAGARGGCELCGLEVAHDHYPLRTGRRLLHFCCPGCRQAYVISRAVHDAEFPEPERPRRRP